MKKILSLASVVAFSFSLFVATAQEQPAAAVQAVPDQPAQEQPKKVSVKEHKAGCCAMKAKESKDAKCASESKDGKKKECDKTKCSEAKKASEKKEECTKH